MRALSSFLTFFFKVIFPAAWIFGFGAGTVAMWLVPMEGPEESPVLVFTVGWVVGSAFLLWLARALKEVWLDGESLWVSNFRRWVRIPLRDIQSVDEIRWLNIHPIILYLRRESAFGDRIVFMPRGLVLPFASHPLARELARLAGESKSNVSEIQPDG